MLAVLLFLASGFSHSRLLVDTDWVARHGHDRNVRVLDLRRSGYAAGHIPDALWLDPESVRDTQNGPDYLLPAAAFEQAMGKLGISDRTRIVLYDDRGGLLAARLWWVLQTFGHANVSLVDGGWVRWTAEKRPVTEAVPVVGPGVFHAKPARQWLATADDVAAAVGKPGRKFIDARTVAEMDGSDTRLSARRGVIPGAIAVYWEDLLDPVRKTFKSPAELKALYRKAGIKHSDEVTAYCWVGHRSAVDLFALRLTGHKRLRNYLGSWEEWSRRSDLPTALYVRPARD